MYSNVYMAEADYLAAVIPANRCPSTDVLEVLDQSPVLRLALEDTWSDPSGRVYQEVSAEHISRWPTHIGRCFTSFLKVSKKPAQVFELLDLLNELCAGEGVVRMTLVGCRRRESLQPAITYYRDLIQQLDAVTSYSDLAVEIKATKEPRFKPQLHSDQVQAGSWTLADPIDKPEDNPVTPPCYRADLLHDPASKYDSPNDWIHHQPWPWKRLYYTIKSARVGELPALKQRLIDCPTRFWSHSQMKVLWDTYRIRRDYLRRRQESRAKQVLGPMAAKLVQRISRSKSHELGHVGKCLYEAMKGVIQLPAPVTPPEWAVVFSAYRAHKSECMSSN